MKSSTFIVRRAEHGHTLVEFIAGRMSLSGRKAKALIDARAVLIGTRPVWMARHAVSEGDSVTVMQVASAQPEADVRVLYRDADVAVIDKPCGLLTNGTRSMEDRVRARLSLPSAMAVHRLDRDTTGCVLFALNPEAFARLVEAFTRGQVLKIYNVIAAGSIGAPEKTVTRAVDGQHAVTHFRIVSENRKASHLTARLETGRTHQIRKHLTGSGCPVVGDRVYGLSRRHGELVLTAARQMLHAAVLQFPHPVTGQRIKVTAPLPKDFKDCLRSLGLR